jgi:ABC-type multidrug transport system fused ATPase/permease subunit
VSTFWRLLGFLRPFRRGVVWSLALAGAATGGTVAIPALTGAAVDAIQRSDSSDVTRLGLFIVLAGLGRWVLNVARRLISGQVSLGVELLLRQTLYDHLQSLELGFFDRQQTGQLMSRSTVDLQSVRFFLGYGLVWILQAGLTISFTAVAMFIIDPLLALVALSPVPFVVWVSARYGRRSRPALQEVQQRIAELTANAEEDIGGVRVVKSFAQEHRRYANFERSVARVFAQQMISTRLAAFYNPLIGFLPQVGLALLLLIGGRQVINGNTSLGDFTAFYTYLLALLGPMRSLGISLGLAQRATASGARLFQILDRAPELVAPAGARHLPDGAGDVRLEHVTLRYPDATADALHDVSLHVSAGTTLALVGATGSGKTSLVALLARLYDVTEGSVRIDGADVREVDLRSLRSSIAVVDDNPFLFSATVRDNIAYARPDATDQEVETAARRAQAHEFIDRLPEGYATRVGERGLTLSGGQRQRVAIARALVADPRILVLDDATSSVDASTEQLIKVALAEAMAGRTTFVIAHRLSTIALADEIAVLEGGRLVAKGTHEELLQTDGLYREIVEKGLPDQVFLTRKPAERQAAGL